MGGLGKAPVAAAQVVEWQCIGETENGGLGIYKLSEQGPRHTAQEMEDQALSTCRYGCMSLGLAINVVYIEGNIFRT